MNCLSLEDFGTDARAPQAAPPAAGPAQPTDFDAAYNAGWDDAMAQTEADQSRVSEALAERLESLGLDHKAAMDSALTGLEPVLRDVFDRLLPHMAHQAFLPVLMQEITEVMEEDAVTTILVAPEETAALSRLLERAQIGSERAQVRAEPSLSLAQALICWPGGERRVDLEGVLSALDEALESFLATMDRASENPAMKEAANA